MGRVGGGRVGGQEVVGLTVNVRVNENESVVSGAEGAQAGKYEMKNDDENRYEMKQIRDEE